MLVGCASNYEYKIEITSIFTSWFAVLVYVCVCVWCVTLKLPHKMIFDQSVEGEPWECYSPHRFLLFVPSNHYHDCHINT